MTVRRRRRRIKAFLNRRLARRYGSHYYQYCGHDWCWRWANYQYRCPRHQDDP